MEHAILITAYKDLPGLTRRVRCLGPRARVFIHLDRRSRVRAEDLEALSALPQVRLVSRRYRVHWGSLAHLKAILHLAETALKDPDTSYVHAISGSDHPLLPWERFASFFKERDVAGYLEHFPLPTPYWRNGGLDRIGYWHPLDLLDIRKPGRQAWVDRFLRLQRAFGIERSWKGLPPLHGGSTWWSLGRACMAHVLDRLAREPHLLRRFRHTRCAEEILVQTLVMDSPFAAQVVNDNLRYVDWHARNGGNPAVLDLSDLPKLETSGKLFARKVEAPVSNTLISALEARVRGERT
ncbi:MAG: hypothetical protein KIT10_06220 [Flavobacteriales bacterium]|nr:hypothetical protein [Flavobacteriales bacterium]